MTNPTPHGQVPEALIDLIDAYAQTAAFQPPPKAAPGVGNRDFDHKTAADFLNGKTVSDEAVRRFVASSRWAHDERASLSAMLLSVRGELASREAEIALLKRSLLDAEAAPQPTAAQADSVRDAAAQGGACAILAKVCDLFQIGALARTESTILSNVENTLRFSNMLSALERDLFPQPDLPEDDDPYAEVDDNLPTPNKWGAEDEADYVSQFKAALLARGFAAPQQGPAFWTRQRFGEEREFCEAPFTTDWTPLYTAPQPAPAPLSDDVVKDAARWRMAALIGNELMLHPDKRTHATAVKAYMDATHSGSDLTGAVDAAIAAQGGKA